MLLAKEHLISKGLMELKGVSGTRISVEGSRGFRVRGSYGL